MTNGKKVEKDKALCKIQSGLSVLKKSVRVLSILVPVKNVRKKMSEQIEEWRDIKNYEGFYQVSNLGRIRSLDRYVNSSGKKGLQKIKGVLLKLQKRKAGHLDILLKKNGKEERCWVHRLVAVAFLENKNNLPIVNHIDSNPENNRVDNLEWCTQKHNIRHCVNSGRFNPKIGETSPFNKLKTEQVIEIRKRFETENVTYTSLSKEYGVCFATIKKIIKREKWKHV